MANKIDCLRDCNALCCRTIGITLFEMTPEEAGFLAKNGAQLIFFGKQRYVMINLCPFLTNNSCRLHGDARQPLMCQINTAGGEHCLDIRRRCGDVDMGVK